MVQPYPTLPSSQLYKPPPITPPSPSVRMSHSRKSSITGSNGTSRDEILLSIEEELIRLTPGLDTVQLGKSSNGASALVTSQLFEVSVDDDVIVRRDLQFTLPVHSPLLRSSARPSISLALPDSSAAPLAITRSQLLTTPTQPVMLPQQQQQQQLNSPYIRMCAQLESFVDRETELADELLMHSAESNHLSLDNHTSIGLTPELERARLGIDDSAHTGQQGKRHSSVPTGSTRSLWLGNLDPTLTEAELFASFSPFGAIELIRLLPAKECAFVNYYALEDALKAREKMNGCALGNLILRIGFGKIDALQPRATTAVNSIDKGTTEVSTDSRSIWIGNVGPEVIEEDLLHHFSSFGMIESCRVLNGKNCAFVNFYTVEGANSARQAMNGAIIGSSVIKTGYAKDTSQSQSTQPSAQSAQSTQSAQPTNSQPTFASIIGGPASPTPSSSSSSTACSVSPFDPATLKEYRRCVEFNPDEEIPRVLAELEPSQIPALAVDSYGNILLQKIIKHAYPPQLDNIAQSLTSKDLAEIGMNKNGTWVIQKLLSHAHPKLQGQLIKELLSHALDMLEDQFGNYVIQVALQTGHPGTEDLINLICANGRRLATGRFSSRALKSILEDTKHRSIISALAKESVWLAIDGNGVIVLQWIMDCREVPGRMGMISSTLQGRVAQIALTKQGSAIIARLIGSTEEPAARDSVIKELFKECDQLLDLLREASTCAILCKAFQMSKPTLRLQLAQNLAPKLMQVLQESTGLSEAQIRSPQADHSSIPIHLSKLHQEVILSWCK